MGSGEAKNSKGQTLKANQIDTADQSYSPETKAAYQALKDQLQAAGIKATPTFYQLPYSAPQTSLLTVGLTSGLTFSASDLTEDAGTVWDRLVANVPKLHCPGELTGKSASTRS